VTLLPGAYGAGSAGQIVGDFLDATITSRASAANLATVDLVVDAILVLVTAIDAKTTNLPGASIDGYTQQQAAELILAALTGLVSGAELGQPVYRSADNTANRIAALVTSAGNRTAVTLTPTP
jgi:hypothetical protein